MAKEIITPSTSSQVTLDFLNEERREIGYMAWPFVQATMPHRHLKDANGLELNEFERRNGDFLITMQSPRRIGLPYGGKPRLILLWITTQAVKTQSPIIELGKSQNDFIRSLNLGSEGSGGENGNIRPLKDQMQRLLMCNITCFNEGNNDKGFLMQSVKPVTAAKLYWWGAKNPEQQCLWESTLTLGHDYYSAIINSPVPVNIEALKALQRSPMAMDIYCWLTFRNSYAKTGSKIPWEVLQMQFGAGYPKTIEGKRNFKKKFIKGLRDVMIIYPDASKLSTDADNLIYVPGRPDIPKKLIPGSRG